MSNKAKHNAAKAKQNNKAAKKDEPREVIIREGQYQSKNTSLSHEEYYEGEAAKPEPKRTPKKSLSNKSVIRICIILLVLVLGLGVYFNRESFEPENLTLWFKTKLMGAGTGDGYPVSITGSSADSANFTAQDGNCAVLSDTSFSLLNTTGKEIIHFRHSYNSPAMSSSGGKFLLYNAGGTGYTLLSANSEAQKKTSPDKITAGAIAQNGRFALAVQPGDYASQLNVYLPSGVLKATYRFAQGYITALAVNKNGSGGAVSMVFSESGRLYSRVQVFDFDKEEPVAQFQTENNIITHLSFNQGDKLFAAGDKKAIYFDGAETFEEFDYQGKAVTAVTSFSQGIMISISGYQRSGACTVLTFTNSAEPTQTISEDFVTSISANNAGYALLSGSSVKAFRHGAQQFGACDAGYDAKAVSLLGTSSVYILGVREVRFNQLTAPEELPQSSSPQE